MKPIVICGPTASGKTDLALEIARQTGGIIISADSRQVYKHLTVGTAKPQGTYQNGLYTVQGVPYLLVDFLDVTAQFNAGDFCKQAAAIATQYADRPLIFAGGTGIGYKDSGLKANRWILIPEISGIREIVVSTMRRKMGFDVNALMPSVDFYVRQFLHFSMKDVNTHRQLKRPGTAVMQKRRTMASQRRNRNAANPLIGITITHPM